MSFDLLHDETQSGQTGAGPRNRRWARSRVCTLALSMLLLLSFAGSPDRAQAGAEDLNALLEGVSEIAAPGVPGPLCVFGPDAFAVAVGRSGGSVEPVMAAGRLGSGRVAAFGHGGYVGKAALDTADTGRLMDNLIRWAAGGKASPSVGVYQVGGVAVTLQDRGFDAEDVDLAGIESKDVVFAPSWNNEQSEVETLQGFVRAGGGLISASTGWGWQQLNPSLDILTDFGGNRMMAPVGIAWADAYLQRNSDNGYAVSGHPPELTHAGIALDALLEHNAGTRQLSDVEMDQASTTLTQAARCLPPEDTLLLPRLRSLTEDDSIHWIPSKENPVVKRNILGKIVLILQERDYRKDPAAHLLPHPAAVHHPGLVDPDAERITSTLDIDASVPDWHSTGLYAAPGEAIKVRIPEAAAEAGLRLRIGAHADRIHGRDNWVRAPAVSFDWPLEAAETEHANAFGGLIYIVVPRNSDLGKVAVEIEGAVASPLYLRGKSDPNTWSAQAAASGAPWAEVGSGKMIVTFPIETARWLQDPEALAATWDELMDQDAELAAIPAERVRAERIVPDVSISVGYMHAGYPIMTHDDQYRNIADAEHIRGQGNWGFFHEVGHNHQSRYWTFAGTGEVTVNLFSLYNFEHLVGIPVKEHDRGSLKFTQDQMAKFDFANPDHGQWQSDPFLALTMYVQMQHAFGWEAYKQVFAEYHSVPQDELPTTDQEERDQWMVRFSRTVGYDLGPFFEYWGVPITSEARAMVEDLPDWLPADFPPGNAEPTPPLHTPTTVPPATTTPTMQPSATPEPGGRVYLPLLQREG